MKDSNYFGMIVWAVIIILLAIAAYASQAPDDIIVVNGEVINIGKATPHEVDRFQRRMMRRQIRSTKNTNEMYRLEVELGKPFGSLSAAKTYMVEKRQEKMRIAKLNRKVKDANWVAWGRQMMYVGKGSSIDHPAYLIRCNEGFKPSFVEMVNVKQSSPNKAKPKDGQIRIGFIWDNDEGDSDWVGVYGKMQSNDARFKATMSSVNKYLRPAAQQLMRGDVMTITTVKPNGYKWDELITIKTPSKKVVDKFLSDCGEETVAIPSGWRKKDQPPKPVIRLHGDTDLHHLVRNGQLGKVRKLVSTASIFTICATNNLGQTPWELAAILGKWETASVIALADGHLC